MNRGPDVKCVGRLSVAAESGNIERSMTIRTFLTVILSVVLSLTGWAQAGSTTVETERLVRVYVLLKNAVQMASRDVAISEDELSKTAQAMSVAELKKACNEALQQVIAGISSGPSDRRPEVFGHMKNARLRLLYDREEKHEGHVGWAKDNRSKVSGEIRDSAREIANALAKVSTK